MNINYISVRTEAEKNNVELKDICIVMYVLVVIYCAIWH